MQVVWFSLRGKQLHCYIYQSLENKCFILRVGEIIPRPKVVAKIRQCFTVLVNQSSGRPSLFSDRHDRKKTKQKCVTGHLHFVVLAFFHGQRVITIVHWKKRLSQNPNGQILDREKRRIERSYFIRRKGYFIMDLRGYRLFYCTVGRIVTWHIEIYIW